MSHTHNVSGPLPSLAHFVIFNPTLSTTAKKPEADSAPQPDEPTPELDNSEHGSSPCPEKNVGHQADTDKDIEDDLREAAQIVFYTSRGAGGVRRDTMLRQVGLAKGLIGFADMVADDEETDPRQPKYWSVHTHKSRLIVYSPEPNWFIYISVTLAVIPVEGDSVTPVTQGRTTEVKESTTPLQSISNRTLVDALKRGYDDFCLFNSTFSSHLPPTPSFAALFEKFWTRFAFAFEEGLISPGPSAPLRSWLEGYSPPSNEEVTGQLEDSLIAFAQSSSLPSGSSLGLVTANGTVIRVGPEFSDSETESIIRLVLTALTASRPPPALPPTTTTEQKHDSRNPLGFGFGLRKRDRPPQTQPSSETDSANNTIKEKHDVSDQRKTSGWAPFAWVPGLASSAPTPRSVTPVAVPATSSSNQLVPSMPIDSSVGSNKSTRWPLGLAGFGDAVGNMGVALGLSAAPSPKPDTKGSKTENTTSGLGHGEKPVQKADTSQTVPGIDSAAGVNPELLSALDGVVIRGGPAKRADTQGSVEETGERSVGDGSHGDSEGGFESEGLEAVSDDQPNGSVQQSLDSDRSDSSATARTGTPSDLCIEPPVSSAASQVSQSAVSVHELQEAEADELTVVSWVPRKVWLSGGCRNLIWVIHDRTVIYIIFPDAETHDLPPTRATHTLFRRISPVLSDNAPVSAAKAKPSHTKQPSTSTSANSTIYHQGVVTQATGPPISRVDEAVLANLREILVGESQVREVFAQTPSRDARFAIATRTYSTSPESEGYILTATGGKRDASLTDAERAVRAFAFHRPEFT